MKQGKAAESVLKRSVLKLLKQNTEEILEGPGFGEDCGLIKLSRQGICACSMDPVIGDLTDVGERAVYAAVNNLAASGASPLAVMVSILLPETVKEKELKYLTREIQSLCERYSISILGGHTASSKTVSLPIVTVTGIGQLKGNAYMTKQALPEQDIVMTKYAALEGTALIAREKEEELVKHYSKDFIAQAKAFLKELSIVEEAEAAASFGISSMHDVRSGGIYGALWELTSAAEIGMEVVLEKIPIRQETVEICEFYDLNPYRLLSGGSLLITAERGYDLAEALKAAGVPACVIGKTKKEQKRLVIREGEAGFLEPSKSDELYKVLSL